MQVEYIVFIVLILTIDSHAVIAIKQVKVDGDILIGGLFPVHEAGRHGEECGVLKPDQGVQRLQAMLFALQEVNNNRKILPNIRLGAQILDTW